MKYTQNRYSKLFESTWDKYIEMNPTEIVLVGKKTSYMKETPKFNLIGSFSGWEEKDVRKDIMSENETTIKLRIKDLINCYSQPGVLDGNGKLINEGKLNVSLSNDDENPLLLERLEINKDYAIKLSFQNTLESKISIKNDYGQIYCTGYPETDRNDILLKFKTTSPNVYLDFGKNINSLVSIQYGQLDGSIRCPIDNIKSNIDHVTVSNRTFKIDGQKLSAANTLMVVYLSNNS